MSGEKQIHVLIVGTGAVGAFYGSRLAQAPNVKVSVTCRSNYSAVKANGISLETHSFGNYHFQPFAVYPSIQAAAALDTPEEKSAFDFIVVSTKALPDVVDDSETIAPLIKSFPLAAIVLIQNGVGVEAPHRERFPENVVLSAVTIVSAEQIRPGVIKQNRWTRISVGPYLDGEGENSSASSELKRKSAERCAQFVQLLKQGGIKDADSYDETGLQQVRWHKLAINSSMNPSAVLSGGNGNSKMALDAELRIHLAGCMNEIFDTAPKILGRAWPEKLAQANAEKILTSTERNAGGLPSMLLDWREARPMELEVILGNPIRIARRKGFEMPRLQTIYALLKMAANTRQEQTNADKAKL